MKKSILIPVLSMIMLTNSQAQKTQAQRNVFIRVYNANYNKMGKGNLLFSSDSTIVIIRHGKADTFSVKQVFYIKTKRSAGHSVLTGTGIGTGVGLTVITVGVVVVSGGGDLFLDPHPQRDGRFAAIASPAIGASIGGILGILRKREAFKIAGNIEMWKLVRKKLLNIHG